MKLRMALTMALCMSAASFTHPVTLAPCTTRHARARRGIEPVLKQRKKKRVDVQQRASSAGRVATKGSDALASVLATCSWDDWEERETWALEDNVRRFAVEDGRFVLWRRLSYEVPELTNRSPKELRSRWLAMQSEHGQRGASASAAWEDVPCLESWHSSRPGRYHGELHGLDGVQDGSLRVTVEHDEEAAAAASMQAHDKSMGAATLAPHFALTDVYGEGWCVRTRAGEIFQLGKPAPSDALADATEEGGPRPAGLLADAASLLDEPLDKVPAAAGRALVPPVIAGGALLAASAIGYMVLGHHHVDVSVFIV